MAYTRGIVTDDGWKYIAVRFPPEVQAKIDSGQIKKPNQEGKDGPSHYGAEKVYPGYLDRDQLYNLKDDPKEKHNLAGDPKHKAKLDAMKALLKKELATMPCPFSEFRP